MSAASTAPTKTVSSPTVSHGALTGSVVAGAAVVLYLVDTVFADFIAQWHFEARQGLHHWMVPAIATLLYICMVQFLPMLMHNRQPVNMTTVMLIHNYILSTGSLVATIAIAREIIPIGLAALPNGDTLTQVVCDPNHSHSSTPLYFWYFVFYLSKMYEFIDTLILILRKKPLIFLHVYHHIITLALCWLMLDDRMAIQWLSSMANTLIHTFMYYFYACQSLGLDVWWKRYLTSAQIYQFIIGNVGNASWAYFRLYLGLDCSGSWLGFFSGIGVIASFLILFIQFYKRSYGSSSKKASNVNKEH